MLFDLQKGHFWIKTNPPLFKIKSLLSHAHTHTHTKMFLDDFVFVYISDLLHCMESQHCQKKEVQMIIFEMRTMKHFFKISVAVSTHIGWILWIVGICILLHLIISIFSPLVKKKKIITYYGMLSFD